MVREAGEEFFGFTTFAKRADFDDPAWASAPSVIQEAIRDKIDVRVTVIDERVFAAKVLVSGKGVSDDWRLHKQHASFVRHDLPNEVSRQCIELVASLGLRYGAIDLALSRDVYYFLEINPTGEWAWLVDTAGLRIDEALADALSY
jgi:glutathione synthase/RimK-type ligase-like ATP-grasp enzyme